MGARMGSCKVVCLEICWANKIKKKLCKLQTGAATLVCVCVCVRVCVSVVNASVTRRIHIWLTGDVAGGLLK